MGRYKMFDDLVKRDKVQVQLLEIQNQKILGKDKLIQNQKESMITKDLLIEKLLREKISNKKGENVNDWLKLMPSTQKKIDKEMNTLKSQVQKQQSQIKKLENNLKESQKMTLDSVRQNSVVSKQSKKKLR